MHSLKTLLQLGRVPNVFTAVSNVSAGYLLTHEDLADWPAVLLLVASSALLYTAGMVLNDVFDVAQDAQQRPQRPIPSGRISLAAARTLGWSLLVGGTLLGCLVAGLRQDVAPAGVALLLAVLIVAYDGPLKSTSLAPVAMGLCRSLNVLLGMSLGTIGLLQWHPMHCAIAAGVGVYVVGLTWFARTEAEDESGRLGLIGGMVVMLLGIALLGYAPRLADVRLPDYAAPLDQIVTGWLWPAMWVLFGFFTIRRTLPAIVSTTPTLVQFAVKQSIFALVIFDAAIVTSVHGPMPFGIAIVALLFPMQILGSYVYST